MAQSQDFSKDNYYRSEIHLDDLPQMEERRFLIKKKQRKRRETKDNPVELDVLASKFKEICGQTIRNAWRRIRSWESRFRLFPPLFPSLSISTSVVTHDGNSHGGSIGQRLKGSKRSVGKLSRLQRQNLRPCVLSHPAKIRERREEENQFLTLEREKIIWQQRRKFLK